MDPAASTRALVELRARLERENQELREQASVELQRQNQEMEAHNRRLQRRNDRLRRKLLAASTVHLRSYLEPLLEEPDEKREADEADEADDTSTSPGSEDGRDRSWSGDSLLSAGSVEGPDATEPSAASPAGCSSAPGERAEEGVVAVEGAEACLLEERSY